jgi:hypothetical protein
MENFKPRQDLVAIELNEPDETYDSQAWFNDSLKFKAEDFANLMSEKLKSDTEKKELKIVKIARKLFGIPEPEKGWRLLSYEPHTEYDNRGNVKWKSRSHIDVTESGKMVYLYEKIRVIDGEPVSLYQENNGHGLIISGYSDAEDYLNQAIKAMNFNLGKRLIPEIENE